MKIRTVLLALVLAGSRLPAQSSARYLIITADTFARSVAPLAEWKTEKGMLARVVRLSEIGTNPSAATIRAYVRNACHTWPIPPEYVLLVGGGNLVPAGLDTANYETDDGYGDVTGDYHVELPVGRFPATTPAECSTMVVKTLTYEKTPFASGDSTWMLKGTTIVNEDTPTDSTYQPDSRYARELWQAAGYVKTESLLRLFGGGPRDTFSRANYDTIRAGINEGRGFVVQHGHCIAHWWTPFDPVSPATLSNGAKLPIVITPSCQTITLSYTQSMLGDQFLRAGSPAVLRGAVAYVGTTWYGTAVSRWRSAFAREFFTALFRENIYRLGGAFKRGKTFMDSLYRDETRYREWNVLGDPELNVWTARPAEPEVTCDTGLRIGPDTLLVRVLRLGIPVCSAAVCVRDTAGFYAWGSTDGNGSCVFPLDFTQPGLVRVMVTGANCLPWCDTIRILPPVALEEGRPARPGVFSLANPAPNPFGISTVISYGLPEPAHVGLRIYARDGRLVRTLADGDRPAGTLRATWRGEDDAGRPVPRGVYYCRIQSNGFSAVKKIVKLN